MTVSGMRPGRTRARNTARNGAVDGGATVTVRGRSSVPATPDEAVLRLLVTALEPSAAGAQSAVAERSQRLERALDDLGIPEVARFTSGLAVGEERDWKDGRQVHRGFRASSSIRLRLTDPGPIGALLRIAVEEAGAEIVGPQWQVARHNPAVAEACRQAGLDARRRAEAYADALGVRLGAVASATEPEVKDGLRGEVFGQSFDHAAALESAPAVDVHPGELDVGATVDVVFLLETRG